MEGFNGLFLRVLAISAGCSAVVGPLLLLAPRMRKKIAARSFYVLFLLLALRLMLPFEVKLPAPAVRVPVPEEVTVAAPGPAAPAQSAQIPAAQSPAPAVQSPGAGPSLQSPVVQGKPAATPAPAVRKVPVLHIAAAVWAAGAAACLLWAAGSFLLARRWLLRGAQCAGEGERAVLECLRQELEVRRPVRLYRSGNASTPLALGLFRPVVVLPEDGFAVAELSLVLRHELTHIRRWDVAYKLVLSLACAVNCFNPLVWLMDRAAGRNLELCCDDDVARSLSEAGRREYGRVLLSAAGAGRPLPFTTCFSGGKVQMKERLVNLFTNKKNSAALVCLVLAAALLAGGLVACESAGASGAPGLTAENRARRAQLKEYFDANYTADAASVVLADLTGDGLDEMLVLIMAPETKEQPPSLREEITEDGFHYGRIECLGVGEAGVFQYPDTLVVAKAHVGLGFVYLVPRTDGGGFALLDFRPYFGQGTGSYRYSLYAPDEEKGFAELERDEVGFLLDQSIHWEITSWAVGTKQVQALLDQVQTYRDSGVPLLVYYEDYSEIPMNVEFSYCSIAPEEAFGSDTAADIAALRTHVVTNHSTASFPLPDEWPATPEEALDRLELTLAVYSDTVVFRLPNYEGTWDIRITGWMPVDWTGHPADRGDIPIDYLEDEEWVPGGVYSFETEGASFSELTLWARVVGPDGASAERTIDLLELMEEYAWKSLMDVGCTPEAVAASYLETVARRMYLYEEGSGLLLTAFYGGQSQAVSYIPDREYVLYEGHTLSQREVMDRLMYKEDGANALKYLWMAERGPMEDVSINYTVERVQTLGESALVDITEDIQFRRQGQTELSQSTIRYQVDLVLCEGKWLVADVNHWGHFITWSDSWDEDSCCELTGLPHSMNWFNDWFGRAAGHEEILKVTDGDTAKLPCCCLAGRVLEDGNLELICAMADGWMCRMTVRLLADDSVEILSGKPLGGLENRYRFHPRRG